MHHRAVTVLAAAVVLTVAGCANGGAGALPGTTPSTTASAGAAAPSPSPSKYPALYEAASNCAMFDPDIGDNGMSITFDTEGKEDPATGTYDTIDEVACVLNALKVPDYVVSHIDDTRALDGMQEDSWGDYTARWTYHPDDGVSLTVFVKQ